MNLSSISFRVGSQVNLDQALAVYRDCSLGERRPVDDRERMRSMLRNANLVVTAWDGEMMVGIARSLSDKQYVTYLADLAVRTAYQRIGIGRELIRHTRAAAPNAEIVLLAAPGAEGYYEHVGFGRHPQAWTSKQSKNPNEPGQSPPEPS
jgi:GNAT superfamily N-acetyltransferase